MITVHHLNNSRSQRILWLLEELELPYEIRFYQRDPKTMLAPAELRKVHPLGKSPVITDGDLTIAESAAIIEYLVDRYDQQQRFKPVRGSHEQLNYTYWLHYAEGSLMPLLMMKLVFNRLSQSPVPWLFRPIGKVISLGVDKAYLGRELTNHHHYLEQHLAKSTWFAGEQFSAADIQMSFPIEAMNVEGMEGLAHSPHLQQYLQAIHARPAYIRALEKGGAFDLLM